MLIKQATTLSKRQISVSGIELLVCKAAQVTQADEPSSPMQRERSQLLEGRSGTFKCWLGTERSRLPSATSKRTWKHKGGLWIWFESLGTIKDRLFNAPAFVFLDLSFNIPTSSKL
jgi:hypothetical protein